MEFKCLRKICRALECDWNMMTGNGSRSIHPRNSRTASRRVQKGVRALGYPVARPKADTPVLTPRSTRRAMCPVMNNSRVSRPMIVAILMMFGAWLALGFYLNGRQTGWASGFFFIAIARWLLMAGVIICLLATGIAWCMKVKAAAGRKIAVGAGAIAALIIAALSAFVAACGVWDVAYGRGGGGEWSGLGVLFVFVVCIPGGIAALIMAITLKSMGRVLKLTCIVLALLALGLPFAMGPLKKARDKRRFDEIMNSGRTRKMIEAAERETPKEKPAEER